MIYQRLKRRYKVAKSNYNAIENRGLDCLFDRCRPDQFDISGRLAKPKLNHKLKHQARALVDCSSGRGFGVVDLFDVILHRDRCTEEKECR